MIQAIFFFCKPILLGIFVEMLCLAFPDIIPEDLCYKPAYHSFKAMFIKQCVLKYYMYF